jgi:integrase
MPEISINKRSVDAAATGAGRAIYWDRKLKGFGLLVTEAGAKSYVVQYRAGRGRGSPTRRVTIGKHGSPWTPETAREAAERLLASVTHGADPAAERAAARKAAKAGPDTTRLFSTVLADWLNRDQAGNRSKAEVERLMRREVEPHWGALEIGTIRKRDVIALVDGIADRGARTMANRTLAHVRRLFNWAASRDIIDASPAQHVEKPAAETRRDRTLSDDELACVWRAAAAMGPHPFGAGVRLLLLTGARRDEIFSARWGEIDGATLRLPADRSKSKDGRSIALTPRAVAVLETLPRVNAFVLTGGGCRSDEARQRASAARGVDDVAEGTPYQAIGKSKAAIDTAICCARRDAAEPSRKGEPLTDAERKAHALPDWRLHDLRRTVATGMQRLGVRLEVIEAVLGHVSGSRAGIVGVYQRHAFEAEAREALARWGAHVERLLSGETSNNVVELRRA